MLLVPESLTKILAHFEHCKVNELNGCIELNKSQTPHCHGKCTYIKIDAISNASVLILMAKFMDVLCRLSIWPPRFLTQIHWDYRPLPFLSATFFTILLRHFDICSIDKLAFWLHDIHTVIMCLNGVAVKQTEVCNSTTSQTQSKTMINNDELLLLVRCFFIAFVVEPSFTYARIQVYNYR